MITVNGFGRGGILAFGALVAGAALSFLSNVMIAKLLGPTGTGAIVLAVTLAGIGATIARAGLDNVVLRLASVAHADGNWAALAALYRRSMSIAAALGLALALVMAVVAPHLPMLADVGAAFRRALMIVAIALPPSALLVLQCEFLKACGRPGLSIFLQSALLPLATVIGLAAALLATRASIGDIAWIHTCATTLTALAAMLVWRRVQPSPPSRNEASATGLLRAGRPFLWVALLILVMSWTDLLVLGLWAEAASVGIYAMASKVATVLAFVLIACNGVTAPRFAALHAAGDIAALRRLAQASTGWITLAGLPVVLLILAFPGPVMSIFGPGFAAGALPLQILVAGQVVNVGTGSVGYLLMMTGHERDLRNIMAFAALLNLAANLILVPSLGPTGAAAATAASLALMNLGAYVQVRRRLGVNTLGYL